VGSGVHKPRAQGGHALSQGIECARPPFPYWLVAIRLQLIRKGLIGAERLVNRNQLLLAGKMLEYDENIKSSVTFRRLALTTCSGTSSSSRHKREQAAALSLSELRSSDEMLSDALCLVYIYNTYDLGIPSPHVSTAPVMLLIIIIITDNKKV